MCSKWIKSGFILAMLLVSMVSLSMAACPWFIKNELYSAQCGVLKDVPASAGLLANDPAATAVLDPASITIAPEYGTLVVQANGAFVYDPNPDMKSGTYVTFKYSATNGACAARYAGTAKIQVSCKCRPNVKDITLCWTPATTLDQIKQKLMVAGVDCIGCGVAPTVLDLSEVELAPGRYPYLLKCPGCQDAVGWVTLVPGCEAQAPPLEFCAGSVTMANLPGMIQAACVGAGCGVPVIDYENVSEENGFVSGGYYVAICNPGTECGSWARGGITVIQKCDVVAPPVEICEGKTLAELQALIVATCASDCDEGPVLDLSAVEVDADGFVTGGSYTACCYTVGTTGVRCESCASGSITVVELCDVFAVDIPVQCTTLDMLEDIIDGITSCDCPDSTKVIDITGATVGDDGYVNGGTYKITCIVGPDCESSDTGIIIATPCELPCLCEPVAPPITVCLNEVTIAELEDMIDAVAKCNPLPGGIPCDTVPVINTENVTLDANGFVTGGSYTATCQPTDDCLAVVATGTVTAVPCCKCDAVAPPIEVCPNDVTISELLDLIDDVAACDDLSNADCDATPKIDTTGVTVSKGYVTGGSYKVTCLSNTPSCTDVATGAVTLRTDCCVCEAYAPDICIQPSCEWKCSPYPCHWNCHEYTDEEIKTKIMNPDGKSYTNDGAKCTGDCTQMTIELPTGMDFTRLGNDEVREYTYKVKCRDESGNCVDEDEGIIKVKKSCSVCGGC